LLETERLRTRRIVVDDAPFILELINDPDWHRFIGDRGVRTVEGARDYIVKVPMVMYERTGMGLDLVERKEDGRPIGMCGLIRRDEQPDIDIGFAFLPAYRGHGYAYEAALACRNHGVQALGLKRIVAFTTVDNEASGKLLLRLGFQYEGTIPWGREGDVSTLYAYTPLPPIIPIPRPGSPAR